MFNGTFFRFNVSIYFMIIVYRTMLFENLDVNFQVTSVRQRLKFLPFQYILEFTIHIVNRVIQEIYNCQALKKSLQALHIHHLVPALIFHFIRHIECIFFGY